MKSISVILFIVGLILCPVYFFYCTAFSGSSLERVTVFSQDVSSFSAGGMTVQSTGANAQWNRPVTLELVPEMNPISVQAIIRYLKPASGVRKRASYRIDLANAGETVWEKTFSVSAKKENKDENANPIDGLPKTTILVKTFSVEESGQYILDVREEGDHDLAVARLDVDVRRNVLIPNKVVLISGGIALLLGVAGLIISGKRRA